LFISEEPRLVIAQFEHRLEDLGSLFIGELRYVASYSASAPASSATQASDPASRPTLPLGELEAPDPETVHHVLKSPQLIVVQVQLLSDQIVEARLNAALHIWTLTAAATGTLRDELLGTAE
jgi:hypothetical protein